MMGLTTEDVKGDIIPGAAERWDQSEDGKTWTFHMRDHLVGRSEGHSARLCVRLAAHPRSQDGG